MPELSFLPWNPACLSGWAEGVRQARRCLAAPIPLYKIHHTAFDRGIIGVRPDFVIQVREDVLEEKDGPMLKYGLKSLHNQELLIPARIRDKPPKVEMERRYERFVQ